MIRQLDVLSSPISVTPLRRIESLALAMIITLLVAVSASAQPLRASMPDLAVRLSGEAANRSLDEPFIVFVEDSETPTVYRTAWVTAMGGIGSALGGSLTVATVGLASFIASDASIWSGSSGDGPPVEVFYVLGAVGATVGTGVMIAVFGQDESDYRGIVPYPDIRPGDGRPALLGALVALPVGIASALFIQKAVPDETDTIVPFLAVPVLQGVGAAVAINLSR